MRTKYKFIISSMIECWKKLTFEGKKKKQFTEEILLLQHL